MKSHDYSKFAEKYAQRDITGTSYLAFRDISDLIHQYVKGKKVLDYGCGAGRSTRFLRKLELSPIGVDISVDMIHQSKLREPEGDYILIKSGRLPFQDSTFDLIFSNAVFLEVPKKKEIVKILVEMKRVMKADGVAMITVETEEAYFGDWQSSIAPPRYAVKSGDKVPVRIKLLNIELYDYYWTDNDYKECFAKSGFKVVKENLPLATETEGIEWIQETKIPHWRTYVLKKN